jgi:hypothetical protein
MRMSAECGRVAGLLRIASSPLSTIVLARVIQSGPDSRDSPESRADFDPQVRVPR